MTTQPPNSHFHRAIPTRPSLLNSLRASACEESVRSTRWSPVTWIFIFLTNCQRIDPILGAQNLSFRLPTRAQLEKQRPTLILEARATSPCAGRLTSPAGPAKHS